MHNIVALHIVLNVAQELKGKWEDSCIRYLSAWVSGVKENSLFI